MKPIKVSEATELQLDWLVASIEGVNEETFNLYYTPTEPSDLDTHGYPEFHYSTIWAQGGPIIEQELIWLGPAKYMSPSVTPPPGREWMAKSLALVPHAPTFGQTALIAAMRCYVASKLGDTAEVPEELT